MLYRSVIRTMLGCQVVDNPPLTPSTLLLTNPNQNKLFISS